MQSRDLKSKLDLIQNIMKEAYADRLQRAKDKLNEERARRRSERRQEDVADDVSYVSYSSYGSFASQISKASSKLEKDRRSEWRNRALEVIERGKNLKEDSVTRDQLSFEDTKEREAQAKSLIHRNALLYERERQMKIEMKLIDAAEAEEAKRERPSQSGSSIEHQERADVGDHFFHSSNNPNKLSKKRTEAFNRSFQEAVAVWQDRCKEANKKKDSGTAAKGTMLKRTLSYEEDPVDRNYGRTRSHSFYQPRYNENYQDDVDEVSAKSENIFGGRNGLVGTSRRLKAPHMNEKERTTSIARQSRSSVNFVRSLYTDQLSTPYSSLRYQYYPTATDTSATTSPIRSMQEKNEDEASLSPSSAISEYIPNRSRSRSVISKLSPEVRNQLELKRAPESPESVKSEGIILRREEGLILPKLSFGSRYSGHAGLSNRKSSNKRRSIRDKSPVALETYRRQQLSEIDAAPKISYRQKEERVWKNYDDHDSFCSYLDEYMGLEKEQNENVGPEDGGISGQSLSYREKNAILAPQRHKTPGPEATEDEPPIKNIFPHIGGSTKHYQKETTHQAKSGEQFVRERVFKDEESSQKTKTISGQGIERLKSFQMTPLENENRELKSRLEKERTRRTELDNKTATLLLELHQKTEEITKFKQHESISTIQKNQFHKVEDAIKQTKRRLELVVDEGNGLRLELDKERGRSGRLRDQTKQLQQQLDKKSDELVALAKELKRKDDKFRAALHEERSLRETAESQLAQACFHWNNSEQGNNDDFEQLEQENIELRHAIQRLEMYLKQKINNDQQKQQALLPQQQQPQQLFALREEEEGDSDTSHRKVRSSPQGIERKPTWSTAVSEITTDFAFDELNDSQMAEI